MTDSLPLKFLHRFNGAIWNIIANEDSLVAEVRTSDPKQASFSALALSSGNFIWRDRVLEENWWVNASALCGDKVVFTVYVDTNNPDKKGILVYSLADLQLIWWNNDFSLSAASEEYLRGFKSKLGLQEVVLEISTGREIPSEHFPSDPPTTSLRKPVQYNEGEAHYETVRNFLADRFNFVATTALEYLQLEDKIVISCYSREGESLANYLFVLSTEGNVLLKEKLDGPLKGIGFDTFFVLQGCLIFVRNKVELVSYKIL